jgi:hypothetical protein
MIQPVNIEQRRGSAAVALRRLAHPERDGSAVVEEPVSEPINPERDGGVVVGGVIQYPHWSGASRSRCPN